MKGTKTRERSSRTLGQSARDRYSGNVHKCVRSPKKAGQGAPAHPHPSGRCSPLVSAVVSGVMALCIPARRHAAVSDLAQPERVAENGRPPAPETGDVGRKRQTGGSVEVQGRGGESSLSTVNT